MGLLVAGLHASSLAQTSADGRWHGNMVLTGNLAAGNSTTRGLAGTADLARETPSHKLGWSTALNMVSSQADGQRALTSSLARAASRYDHNLDQKLFAYLGGEAETNRAGSVRLRTSVATGLGYKLWRDQSNQLEISAGAGRTRLETTEHLVVNAIEANLALQAEQKWGRGVWTRQKLNYYLGDRNLGDRATLDTNLSAPVIDGWTLELSLAATYQSLVADGTKPVDMLLTMGFGYKF